MTDKRLNVTSGDNFDDSSIDENASDSTLASTFERVLATPHAGSFFHVKSATWLTPSKQPVVEVQRINTPSRGRVNLGLKPSRSARPLD